MTYSPRLGSDRTHKSCISNQIQFRLRYRTKSFWGSYFIQMDPEFINSVFALFEAILYELLIAGLMDLGYQTDAYEAFTSVLVNRGKRASISGEQRKKGQILRGTKTILGNREHVLREQRNKPIYFRGAMEQAPPLP